MRAFFPLLLMCLFGGTASAVLIEQTQHFGEFSPGVGRDLYEASFSFNKFGEYNPGDWELNSVTIEYYFTAYGGIIAQDNDTTNGVALVDAGFDVTASLATTAPMLNEFWQPVTFSSSFSDYVDLTLDVDDNDAASVYDTGGPDWVYYESPTRSDAVSETLGAMVNTFYGGSGTFSFDLTSEQTLTELTDDGVISDSVYSQADGYIKVIYDFVPEPMTMSLMGAGGLVALVANRLRRRGA